jgi:DNA polymerase
MAQGTDRQAAEVAPAAADLDELRVAAAGCTNCGLYVNATQTVFGDGPQSAWLMLVGEQPGDREDLAGEPFVGPAGRLLDRALEQAGIDRDEAYITNVVKHFKFKRQGKRRIHQRPSVTEVRACRPWFDAELRVVRPSVLAALGATAAQALLGRDFRITEHRGEVLEWEGLALVPTIHPSAVLRAQSDRRDEDFASLVSDLKQAAAVRP